MTDTAFLTSSPEFTEHSFPSLDLAPRRARGNRQELAFLRMRTVLKVRQTLPSATGLGGREWSSSGHWDAEGPFSWFRL